MTFADLSGTFDFQHFTIIKSALNITTTTCHNKTIVFILLRYIKICQNHEFSS
jgi:hypothetical protein